MKEKEAARFIKRMFIDLEKVEAGIKGELETIARLNADIDRLISHVNLDPADVRGEAMKSGCTLAEAIARGLGLDYTEFRPSIKKLTGREGMDEILASASYYKVIRAKVRATINKNREI